MAVDRILLHPGWDTRARLNDILAGHDLALLVLSREVDMYSTTTVPICLPGPADSFLAAEGRAGRGEELAAAADAMRPTRRCAWCAAASRSPG